MITMVLGYSSLKQSGMYLSTVSLESRIGILLKVKYRKFAHVTILRLTVAKELLHLTARSCVSKPVLSLHRNTQNHQPAACISFYRLFHLLDSTCSAYSLLWILCTHKMAETLRKSQNLCRKILIYCHS